MERKVIKREIRENQLQQFALEKEEAFEYGFGNSQGIGGFEGEKKGQRITTATENVSNDSRGSETEREFISDREVLFPPLLEPIPYIAYDPFLPPFRYKRETRYKIDVREDFFGNGNFGFPKFYDRRVGLFR